MVLSRIKRTMEKIMFDGFRCSTPVARSIIREICGPDASH